MNETKTLPISSALMKEGHTIERGRIHSIDEILTCEKDLTYRTDFENIKKFGRANMPGQSLFYGAFRSSDIEYPRLVNLMELSEVLRNNEGIDSEFRLTVGRWRIKKEFEVAELVFNEKYLENSDIKSKIDYHENLLMEQFPDKQAEAQALMRFFTDEFAKKEITSHFDYMISCAYTDLVMHNSERRMAGVAYPSVRADYKAFNVALAPHIVDSCLELEMAAMFRVITQKDKHNYLITEAMSKNFGIYNTDFNWVFVDGKDEEDVERELMK